MLRSPHGTCSRDAEMPEPGTYVLYLQVRVDGFLHTLPLVVTVA